MTNKPDLNQNQHTYTLAETKTARMILEKAVLPHVCQ